MRRTVETLIQRFTAAYAISLFNIARTCRRQPTHATGKTPSYVTDGLYVYSSDKYRDLAPICQHGSLRRP
jgi:hypothetical protein